MAKIICFALARSYPRYRGRGDYVKTVKRSKSSRGYRGAGVALGTALGAGIGSIAPGIGTAIGAPIGGLIGYAADKIFGWGDYKVRRNSLLFKESVPSFGNNCIRVQHREYIASISSSTTFNLAAYNLNPGLSQTFPWLSEIAKNYEMYHFNGMIFQFMSTSADALNSTNTALGKVVMATDYNAMDDDYVSVQQMMGTQFANMGKPSDNILHAIECDPGENPLKLAYVRTGNPPADADLRLYDLGKFQIATTGSQAAAVVGDLWVSYDVSFCKPVQNNVVGLSLPVDHFQLTTTIDNSNPFGSASGRIAQAGSNLGCTLSATTISFPPNLDTGVFKVNYSVVGNSTALDRGTHTLTNCVAQDILVNDSTGFISNTGSTATRFFITWIIEITAPGATLAFAPVALPASASSGDLFIAQIPTDMV